MAIAPPSTANARPASSTHVDHPPRGGKPGIDPVFYLMLLPALILFTIAITFPALFGIFYSFTNYSGFGTWKFTGLTNYLAMFSDPAIIASFGFTIGFSIVTVIIVNVLSLALAIGLSAKIRFKTALRAIYVIPMVISGIVIAFVFNYLFSNSLPQIAAILGIKGLETSLLANPQWAWVAIVVVAAWQSIPGMLLIYIAGLLSIDGGLYEAASLDGATAWRQFTSVTLPLMSGYVVINTVLGFKNFLNVYDIIVGLTNGGPGSATTSVAMTIFTGFTSGDYAYQMATATVFFIVTVLISVAQLRVTRGRTFTL